MELSGLLYGFSTLSKREWRVLITETNKAILQFLNTFIDPIYERWRWKATHSAVPRLLRDRSNVV